MRTNTKRYLPSKYHAVTSSQTFGCPLSVSWAKDIYDLIQNVSFLPSTTRIRTDNSWSSSKNTFILLNFTAPKFGAVSWHFLNIYLIIWHEQSVLKINSLLQTCFYKSYFAKHIVKQRLVGIWTISVHVRILLKISSVAIAMHHYFWNGWFCMLFFGKWKRISKYFIVINRVLSNPIIFYYALQTDLVKIWVPQRLFSSYLLAFPY